MPRGDRRHAGGRLYRWGPILLVLVVLASAAASYRFDLGERWLGIEAADPVDNPAAVAPPEGLDLPEPSGAPSVGVPLTVSTAGSLDPERVRTVLARRLHDPDLGKRVVAMVADLSDGRPVTVQGAGGAMGAAIPASTLKLLTATAALATVGPETTFRTRVVSGGGSHRIVLVGGGDPYLAGKPLGPREQAETYPSTRADVATLARRTAAALQAQGVTRVRLGYDDSLFTGPAVNAHWEPDYVSGGVVSPITALWVDRGTDPSGFGRVADPALTAATAFGTALTRAGVTVAGRATRTRAVAGAAQVASVESAPLEQIVQEILDTSDNEGAEVLLRHVGLAAAGEGSFSAGVAAMKKTLRGLGVPLDGAVVHDGSGLSRQDRLRPETLVAVLRAAASDGHPELRAVIEGLPVAGFTGSLTERFADGDPAGRGRVRAKTGTLSGVHALAGIVEDLDGTLMVVVLIADRVALEDTLDARAALDRAAAALAGCRCGRPA